ncbi:MAG: plastocyanin/azurin family copper-binding protein [Thermomicrobiales bacterium]
MRPTKLTRRTLIIGATGLTAATVIAMPGRDADGADEHAHATPSPIASPVAVDAPKAIVHIDRFAFKPRDIEINAGTRVVWSNDDGAAHTVTADDKSFDSGQLTFSEKFGHTFEQPGTYTYYCAFHANMTGKVTVTK